MPIFTDTEHERLQADADRWRETYILARDNAAASLQAANRISQYRQYAPQLPPGAYVSLAQAGVDADSPQFQEIASSYIPSPTSNRVRSPADELLDATEAEYGRNEKGMVRIGPLQKLWAEADAGSEEEALYKEAVRLAREEAGIAKPDANPEPWWVDAGKTVESGVKGLSRGVTAGGMYVPEVAGNVVAGIVNQGTVVRGPAGGVQDPPWSRRGLANMFWRGTATGQVLAHPDLQGKGYFAAQAGEGAEEAKKATLGVDAAGDARTIGSRAIEALNQASNAWVNLARPAGQPEQKWDIATPGSGAWNLIRGGTDLVVYAKTDALGNAAFDKYRDYRVAHKTFDVVKETEQAGAFRNALSKFTSPQRYDRWVDSYAGQRVVAQLTRIKSAAEILDRLPQLKKSPGGIELAHSLALADDSMVVSEMLRASAGSDLRAVPRFGAVARTTGGMGYQARRVTQNVRWAQMVPGGHISWKDLGRGYPTFERALQNARLPQDIRRDLQDRYISAAAIPEEGARQSAIYQIVRDSYDTIHRSLAGRGYWSGKQAKSFAQGLVDTPVADIHATTREALTHGFPELTVTDDLVDAIAGHASNTTLTAPERNKAIRDALEEVAPFQRRKVSETLAERFTRITDGDDDLVRTHRWWLPPTDPNDTGTVIQQISVRLPDGSIGVEDMKNVTIPTHILNDGILLPDYKTIRRASSRYTNIFTMDGKDKLISPFLQGDTLAGIPSKYLAEGETRLAIKFAEKFNSYWKNLKIFAPRLAVQSVAEANFNAAAGGVDTLFFHPLNVIGRMLRGVEKVPTTYDEVLAELEMTRRGVAASRAVKGMDEATSELLTAESMEGYRIAGMPTGNPLARESVTHEQWAEYARGSAEGRQAHAEAVVQFHGDPVTRKVAAAMERDAEFTAARVAEEQAHYEAVALRHADRAAEMRAYEEELAQWEEDFRAAVRNESDRRFTVPGDEPIPEIPFPGPRPERPFNMDEILPIPDLPPFNPNKAVEDYVEEFAAETGPNARQRELVANATSHEREVWRENLRSPDPAVRAEAARFYVEEVKRQIRNITSDQTDLLGAIARGVHNGDRIIQGRHLNKFAASLEERIAELHDAGVAPVKIRGPRIKSAGENNSLKQRLGRGFDKMMDFLAERPMEHLTNKPILFDAWHAEARRLLPGVTDDELKQIYNASLDDATHAQAVRSFPTPVSPTGEITAAEVDLLARHHAQETLRSFVFDAHDKAQWADMIGVFAPFINVIRSEMIRAARIGSENAPRIIRRTQQFGDVASQSHFIGRDPLTGEMSLHIVLPGLVKDAIGMLPGVDTPEVDSIDVALSTLPNVAFNATPGLGPVGVVALDQLVSKFDSWGGTDLTNSAAVQAAMPFGTPEMSKDGLFKLFAPAFAIELAKASAGKTAKTNIDAQAYFMWYLQNENPEKYSRSPEDAGRLAQDALEMTRGFHFANSWAKAWLPGTAKMPFRVKTDSGVIEMTMVANKLRELQREAYDDPNEDDPVAAAIEQFINLFGADMLGGMHEKFGDKTDPAFEGPENPEGRADEYYANRSAEELYKSVQAKSVPLVYGLMPTKETARFRKKNVAFTKKYPDVWPLFVEAPSAGDTGFYALGYQPMTGEVRGELDDEYANKERRSVTLNEARQIGEIRLGQYNYDRYRNLFGVNPTQEQWDFLHNVEDELGKEYPSWGKRNDKGDPIRSLIGGKIDHDAAVDDLARAVTEPAVRDTPAAQGLDLYLAARKSMLDQMGVRNSSSLSNKNAGPIRAYLRSAAEIIGQEYPGFVNIYDKILGYETREPRA